MVVEPRYPFERGELDCFLDFPWSPAVNQFGLVQAVDGLGQGVVIAVALAAHRRLDASFRQSLGVANADVLLGKVCTTPAPGPQCETVKA